MAVAQCFSFFTVFWCVSPTDLWLSVIDGPARGPRAEGAMGLLGGGRAAPPPRAPITAKALRRVPWKPAAAGRGGRVRRNMGGPSNSRPRPQPDGTGPGAARKGGQKGVRSAGRGGPAQPGARPRAANGAYVAGAARGGGASCGAAHVFFSVVQNGVVGSAWGGPAARGGCCWQGPGVQ
jgi:hypothetical protein